MSQFPKKSVVSLKQRVVTLTLSFCLSW